VVPGSREPVHRLAQKFRPFGEKQSVAGDRDHAVDQ